MGRLTCNYLEERGGVQQSAIATQTDDQVNTVWDIIKTCGQENKIPLHSVSHIDASEGFSPALMFFYQQLLLQRFIAAHRKVAVHHKVMAYAAVWVLNGTLLTL